MKKEKTYNEAVEGDEGFIPGEGYPSCDGQPCVNVSVEGTDGGDTVADTGTPAERIDTEGMGEEQGAQPKGAEAAAAEWQDRCLRLQAEFDNFRKRTLREKMELVATGGRDVLMAMLPVRDDVERALAAMEQSDDLEALREGVRLIAQKFTEALRQRGVTEIDVRDKPFDEETSEAVARMEAGEERRGTVIDVVQTGYRLGDKVLRFAKVVVGA